MVSFPLGLRHVVRKSVAQSDQTRTAVRVPVWFRLCRVRERLAQLFRDKPYGREYSANSGIGKSLRLSVSRVSPWVKATAAMVTSGRESVCPFLRQRFCNSPASRAISQAAASQKIPLSQQFVEKQVPLSLAVDRVDDDGGVEQKNGHQPPSRCRWIRWDRVSDSARIFRTQAAEPPFNSGWS